MPPPGLHSLILYDNFEWKTAQKSHENLQNICDLTRIPAISLEEFETEFYGVLKDNYHGKLIFRNLAKIDNLKICIISDILAGKSIEKSYKDMSEVFGAGNIDFLDMDFWYYRFYNGNYDLDYDRKLDPKPLRFLNIPIIIHHKVIDNLDLGNQLTLRKVSKSLKTIVDQGKPNIKNMTICFDSTEIDIGFNNFSAYYSEDLGVDYRKIALNHVMIVLENPKLRLDALQIVSPNSIDPFFIDFLKTFKHKISTKYLYLDVDCPESTMILLTCIMPKRLALNKGNIDEIVKLDQWKCMNEASFYPLFPGPIDYFLGFSEFCITLQDVTEELLIKLKERLSKSQNFENCQIFYRSAIRLDLIEKVFFSVSGPAKEVNGYFEVIQYSYTIPNSGNVLEIIISCGLLMFKMIRSS